jgi:hypothetical protein
VLEPTCRGAALIKRVNHFQVRMLRSPRVSSSLMLLDNHGLATLGTARSGNPPHVRGIPLSRRVSSLVQELPS